MSGENTASVDDEALFLERLDVFLEKSLDDLREFALREGRDFEQIRTKAAEWHCKHLFDAARSTPNYSVTRGTARAIVNNVLNNTSRTLETLQSVADRHSLLLVVDPNTPDDADEEFLWGTHTGREFWRGFRNGGAAGAKSFKEFCRRATGNHPYNHTTISSVGARQMKNNLYVEMRSRLRALSGIRNAEMKWSKPEKLAIYGVALEGWPANIQYKNPSKMTFAETSILMKLLLENKLYFRSLAGNSDLSTLPASSAASSDAADVSWAVNDNDENPDFSTAS